MKRRTRITVEEVVRISRRTGVSPQIPCSHCGEGWMVAPEEAALALDVTARAIYRWVEESKIHFRESGSGILFVCLRSIREQLRSR